MKLFSILLATLIAIIPLVAQETIPYQVKSFDISSGVYSGNHSDVQSFSSPF